MSLVQPASVIVRLRDVTKRWDASSGLAPLTCSLSRGELVALRGRSGSGKSTLLALLVGWCEPDGGEILRDPASTSTSIVPQVLGLLDELCVIENITIVRRLGGARRVDADAATLPLLEQLDLSALARRLPREISLGQQQRVAVARAAIAASDLLLADEPTCHQDADHAAMVVSTLRAAADRGAGVLVASHDDFVADQADRVISLDG